MFLILLAAFMSIGVQAQTGVPESDPREAISRTKMIESSISKVYRARVLLEDYRNWPESYELLRDVIKNDEDLNPVIKSKLKKAAGQISRHLPGSWVRRAVNARHLLRPFLESSYLINEALMDWRVALNSSTDSEVPFVENLLKSYFFPGSESQGSIEFPDPSTYSFDLFALTPENIAKARRARSDEPTASDAPTNSSRSLDNNNNSIPTPDNSSGSARVGDLGSVELNARFDASNGFIKDVLDQGASIVEVTKEVQGVIARFAAKKRVDNRYFELSMLMQAVSDPGSVLFDPQLQAFLRGVRLKLALGVMDSMNGSDFSNLRGLLGRRAVVQTPEGVRILLSYLMEKQESNPFQRTAMELQVNQVDGTGRSVLYVISTISGEDLMRLRTLNMAAVLARDFDKISTLVKHPSLSPVVIRGMQLSHISFQKVMAALPKAAMLVNQMAHSSNNGVIAMSLKAIAGVLQGAVAVQNLGVKVTTEMTPRTAKLLAELKNNKYVKNGTVAGVLTFVVAATQITVGTIEYRNATDEDVKFEIYVDTLSRTAATMTYILPYVGWAAAALDLSHAFLGVPFETADLYKGYAWLWGETTLRLMGTSGTQLAYTELERKLILPRHDVYFKSKARCDNTRASCEAAIARIHAELQDTALSQLNLLYIAHRTFAAKTNNKFGRRMEDYARSFQQNRRIARDLENSLLQKMAAMPREEQELVEDSHVRGS